jgi:hypothetical protein
MEAEIVVATEDDKLYLQVEKLMASILVDRWPVLGKAFRTD